MRPRIQRRRGFSLLELMIVIAVITIMMTFALPNVFGTKSTERLKAATDDVIDVFHFAKVRAANAFVAYGIGFDETDGGRLRVFGGTGPDCASIDFDNGTAVKTLHFKAPADVGGTWSDPSGTAARDVEIIAVSPDVDQVCFTPDGRFLRASDSKPIPATLEANNYAAGEYIVSIAMADSEGDVFGRQHHIIVSYSGRARFTFGETNDDPTGEGF